MFRVAQHDTVGLDELATALRLKQPWHGLKPADVQLGSLDVLGPGFGKVIQSASLMPAAKQDSTS
jgi:hypothetical protein